MKLIVNTMKYIYFFIVEVLVLQGSCTMQYSSWHPNWCVRDDSFWSKKVFIDGRWMNKRRELDQVEKENKNATDYYGCMW